MGLLRYYSLTAFENEFTHQKNSDAPFFLSIDSFLIHPFLFLIVYLWMNPAFWSVEFLIVMAHFTVFLCLLYSCRVVAGFRGLIRLRYNSFGNTVRVFFRLEACDICLVLFVMLTIVDAQCLDSFICWGW